MVFEPITENTELGSAPCLLLVWKLCSHMIDLKRDQVEFALPKGAEARWTLNIKAVFQIRSLSHIPILLHIMWLELLNLSSTGSVDVVRKSILS